MRGLFPVYLLVVSCLWAQKPPEIVAITPDTVIATINGRKFTAGELERITKNLSPQMRQLAGTQPKTFLEQYAYAESLAKEAEKLKLDQLSPYRERLEDARRQILNQSLIAYKTEQAKIPAAEIEKFYGTNKSGFQQVTAKVIFISRAKYIQNLGDGSTKTAPVEEIKAKVDKVTKLLREGGDFVALAKEYSDDQNSAAAGADLPYPIRANSPGIPENIREALTQAKTGDIVGPLEHDTGFYLFKVTGASMAPLEAVKSDIENELKKAAVQRWMDENRSKAAVTLENDAFWTTFLAMNREELEKQEQARKAEKEKAAGGAKNETR